MEIGKYIDHTNLKMDATEEDINKLCTEAINYQFDTVCVLPYYVPLAKELLKDTNISVCTVVGFPLGMNTPKTKAFEAVEAIELGADEIEMVINVGALKEKDYNYVKNEIEEIRDNIEGKVLKVIIEAPLLTEKEIIKITEICNETFVNYIVDTTGFNHQKIDLKTIKTIINHKSEITELKSQNHLDNFKQLDELINLGVTKIGSSNSLDIIQDK